MQELRQSTAINIKVGMAAAVGDGYTPVTTLSIGGADEAYILKANTTAALALSGTLTAIVNADGWYDTSLTAGDTDELGIFTVQINDDSAVLPIWRDFMIITQQHWDSKYSTSPLVATLASATYTTVTAFQDSATAFSTFDPAADAVSLGSATYTTVTAFQDSATAFSTFDPAADAVSLGSATYTTVTAFQDSATAFSTFDPASDGVTLTSAIYTAIADFKATGFSTFDPAASEVSISAASVDAIHDEVVDGTITDRQATRLILSVLTGKVSGGSTTTITFRDIGDTKNRLVCTVDANGNRTAVGTRDGS